MDFDHIEIRTHAEAVADRGGSVEECPYEEPQRLQQDLWENYFFNRVRLLQGDSPE